MSTIRITKHLTSDTLHLPELRPFIGHEVEITVLDRKDSSASTESHDVTLDEMARRQGITSPQRINELFGILRDPELWTGFDEALESWRAEPPREWPD
jgi:hypothetical protein